jgi:catechol 2,3-dioxygenase-like lactoylglutathione lyase family enzyme
MTQPSLVILYVDNPQASAAFYAELLQRAPVESSPTFAMFVLESGMKFGLWARHTVEPVTHTAGSGGEMAFEVTDADAVRALHAAWKERGLPIVQAPVDMDFGHTFVALDPDGHRLRVYARTVA